MGAAASLLLRKESQKFLPSFKRSGSKNPTACNQSGSGRRGAIKRPLTWLEQNAEKMEVSLRMSKNVFN